MGDAARELGQGSAPLVARFPVIAGPTAGGKSWLAVAVAHELNKIAGREAAEIVTADSIQVYRGLDIGSAKPTVEERGGVVHHLIDVVEPTDSFSVHQWLALAEEKVAEVRSRGRVPIVVGGSHLYIKAFLEGLFEGPAVDPALREELRGADLTELRAELERVDPDAAARIHPADHRRTARALEVFRQTGTPISVLQRQWDRADHLRTDCVLVGLDWPSEAINRRINARVKDMIERGLVEEARALYTGGRLGPQAREALGYKQLISAFEGRCSLDDAIEKMKIETRRCGKNERTGVQRVRPTAGAGWSDAESLAMEEWVGGVMRACGGDFGRRERE